MKPATSEYFYRTKNNKSGVYYLKHECKQCSNKKVVKYRKDGVGKEKQLVYDRTYKRVNKLKAIEYKGDRCNHCGQTFHPAAFDFHHTDPSQKEFNVSHLKEHSWDKLVNELDKCILLCANCHRIEHYKD